MSHDQHPDSFGCPDNLGDRYKVLILSSTYQCIIAYETDTKTLDTISWIFDSAWEVLALCLAVWIAVKHFRELR
ncbi:uncharacterized protein EDB91DRAFT_1246883 [Suillus paluster]|uniref:uncharacterized protein n=1 Tax=Suillus paluster TaxID=48578 RepID=UPI001B86576C|nr:uncharacterized protein EDB91DRAFT_1246883 [Suillus paluster]KAG1743999.1 hypothetical protein EDB91DRAFT_1246883 [Suillus paluster]